jgi:alpha-L-fucosidase
MRTNGDSIYGTSASPLPEYPWGRTTVKAGKLYLHVFSWPADSVIRLSALRTEVSAAYLLADPSHNLAVSHKDGAVLVSLPAHPVDADDTVVVLDLSGPLQVDPPTLTQDTDRGFELDYLTAVTAGKAQKRFNRDGGFHIAKWTEPADSATWHLLVSVAGKYEVKIRYAARKDWQDGKYVIAAGDRTLSAAVTPTGDWYQYSTFDLGALDFSKAGRYTLSLQPAASYNHYLMYFQSLSLEPVR